MAISSNVALRELRSTKCACGKNKRKGLSVCGACFGRLPRELRNRLYDHVGGGYKAALENALLHLELDLPREETENTEGAES
jgi:hypothetical protein